jgi:hypothetical protein
LGSIPGIKKCLKAVHTTINNLLYIPSHQFQIPFPQSVPHNTMTDIMQKEEELIPKSEAESQASRSQWIGSVSGSLTMLAVLTMGTGLWDRPLRRD